MLTKGIYRFELAFGVRGLRLDENAAARTFRLSDKPTLSVELRAPSPVAGQPRSDDAEGIASVRRKISSEAILESLDRQAAGQEPHNREPTYVHAGDPLLFRIPPKPPPTGKGFYVAASQLVMQRPTWPEAFENFRLEVFEQLHRAASLIARNLRWRSGAPIAHQPIHPRSFRWTPDEREWVEWGVPRMIEGAHMPPVYLTDNEVEVVTERAADDREDPVGWSLLVEAWELRSTNMRASLTLATAAIEAATKEYIASRAPDTRWLVEKAPSPPIVKMIGDYLPRISNARAIGLDELQFAKEFMDRLTKLVGQRNELMHLGKTSLSYESLTSDLRLISDYLWLLDTLSGHSWALERIGSEGRSAFGLLPESGHRSR